MESDYRQQKLYSKSLTSQSVQNEPEFDDSQPEAWSASNWRAPTVMFSSLLLGMVSAFAHHLFYDYCNNKEADEHLPQQWVTRGGTAFAFIVKMFLATSTGTAYVQQAWSSVKSRPVSIGGLDSLFGILSNALRFADPEIWVRNPLLAFPAIITWLIPLASIVTPGTITLNTTLHVAHHNTPVPQLEYNALQFAVFDTNDDYAQPSDLVSRLAISSALQGQILPISVPFPNASYEISFYAPAISCNSLETTSLVQYYKHLQKNFTDNVQVKYISWVPSDEYTNTSVMPNYSPNANSSWMETFLDFYSPEKAQIYVFVYLGTDDGQADYQLLDCSLKNASYTAEFDFNYPFQRISTTVDLREDIAATRQTPREPVSRLETQRLMSYQAVMDAFGRVLVGYTTIASGSGSTVTKGSLLPLTNVSSSLERATNKALGPALEELFQNMTLSLLSSETLQGKHSQVSSVSVAVVRSRIIYVYRLLDLYVAYGTSIVSSILCVGIGVFALYRNGLCYTNNFSTFLRTTRGRGLDSIVLPIDTKGGDPLPKRIATRVVILEDLSRDEDDHGVNGFHLREDASRMLATRRSKPDKKAFRLWPRRSRSLKGREGTALSSSWSAYSEQERSS